MGAQSSKTTTPAAKYTNTNSPTHDMVMLCAWALKGLDFGTRRERFGKSSLALHCPKGVPDDMYYEAIHLAKAYAWHARSQEDWGIDPLDDLPLEFTFYLALAKVMGQPRTLDNFASFDFPSPVTRPETCLYHSLPQEDRKMNFLQEAFPGTDLRCGPQICSHGMGDLFSWFNDIVNEEIEPIEQQSLEDMKSLISIELTIAGACTQHLLRLDLGVKDGLLKPGATIQTVQLQSMYTTWPYILALYLLHRYQARREVEKSLLDVPVEHIFYATLYIAGELFNEDVDHCMPDIIFTRLGFPLPVERQTNRVICTHHAEELEELKENRGEGKDDWGMDLLNSESRSHSRTSSLGRGQGMVSAEAYMGCDGGRVCTRGMMKLKEYLLDRVFKWDINVHTAAERPRLLSFLKGLEKECGIPVPDELNSL